MNIYGLPFQPLTNYLKGAASITLFSCLAAIAFAATGGVLHLTGFNDAAIATGSETFVAGLITGVMIYKRRNALKDHLHALFLNRKIRSTNNLQRTCKTFSHEILKREFLKYNPHLERMRESVRGANDFEHALKRGEAAELSQLGNCEEMAYLALRDVMELFPDLSVPVEVYHIENGDHVFLVIGRKIDSNPLDYQTWGEDAIIYDPWASEEDDPVYYPACDLELRLMDARPTNLLLFPRRAFLERINFQTQCVAPVVSNIFAPNLFFGSPELKEMLVKFHTPGANRVMMAQAMVTIGRDLIKSHVKSIKEAEARFTASKELFLRPSNQPAEEALRELVKQYERALVERNLIDQQDKTLVDQLIYFLAKQGIVEPPLQKVQDVAPSPPADPQQIHYPLPFDHASPFDP